MDDTRFWSGMSGLGKDDIYNGYREPAWRKAKMNTAIYDLAAPYK